MGTLNRIAVTKRTKKKEKSYVQFKNIYIHTIKGAMCDNMIAYTHSNCTHHPKGFDSSRLCTVPTNALRLVLLRTSRLG